MNMPPALLAELLRVLDGMIEEYLRLLQCLGQQQEAMKLLNLPAMDDARNRQEASRLRLSQIDSRRRAVLQQIARFARLEGELTLSRLAEAFEPSAAELIDRRDKLRDLADHVHRQSHIAGRLAAAVLGHLNTVVRLISGAVQQAGVYTKSGVPKVSNRIGAMEAIG